MVDSVKKFLQKNKEKAKTIEDISLTSLIIILKVLLNKNFTNFKRELHALHIQSKNKVIISHININSIRNKFDCLVESVKGNVDILMISETNFDKSFPISQFVIDSFAKPFRIDRNINGDGIILYIREDIPAKLIHIENSPVECFWVEINLRNKKWVISCSYNPHQNTIDRHLNSASITFDLLSSNYDNFLFLGDFNCDATENKLNIFCEHYSLSSLITYPTCFKNPNNPCCIDLILTNSSESFYKSCTVETGLSDFHKVIVTIMKGSLKN